MLIAVTIDSNRNAKPTPKYGDSGFAKPMYSANIPREYIAKYKATRTPQPAIK